MVVCYAPNFETYLYFDIIVITFEKIPNTFEKIPNTFEKIPKNLWKNSHFLHKKSISTDNQY